MPIFLATLSVRKKSPIVRFAGGNEVLEMFGLAKGGKEYLRIVAAFERIFGATIFFTSNSGSATARVVQRARFNFMSAATIWYNGSTENEIVFSDEFYREVAAHPIPIDLAAVQSLAPSPGVLDLFTWLAYRCSPRVAWPCSRSVAGVSSLPPRRASAYPLRASFLVGFHEGGKRRSARRRPWAGGGRCGSTDERPIDWVSGRSGFATRPPPACPKDK